MQLQQRAGVIGDDGGHHLQLAVGLGELQRGLHLVALAHALFLVGGDAFGPLGGDVLDPVEVLDLLGAVERGTTGDAAVGVTLGAEMPVATHRAQASYLGRQAGALSHLILTADGQQGAGDAVLAAFVVDQAVGAELAQRQETRA